MVPEIHPLFKLNGKHYDRTELLSKAYCLVKEGESWEREVGDFLLNWMDDYPYLSVYTSGSTGEPKEYRLKKKHVIQSAEMTGEYFELEPRTKALCCLPLSYIAGKMMLVRAIHLGWDIDLCEASANPFKGRKTTYDFTALVPLQLSASVKHMDRVRKVIVGGAALSRKQKNKLGKIQKTEVYHTYGMTETASHVAVRQIAPDHEESYEPLPGVDLSTTEDGRLVISSERLLDEPLTTNDLVAMDDDGRFTIIGRADEVINTGGVKVHPSQVEQKLKIANKRRFFISSFPDDKLGDKVVLFVEGKKELDLTKAFEKLEKFEKPKETIYIKQFYETHTKKIDKRRTVEQVMDDGVMA